MKAILKSLGYMLFYMLFQIVIISMIAMGLQVFGGNVDVESFMNRNTLLLASVSNILTIVLLVILFKIRGKSLQKTINMKSIKGNEYILPCALAFLFSMVFSLMIYHINLNNAMQIKTSVAYYATILPGLGIILQIIALLIISPIAEEIIFRGLILTVLQEHYHNIIAIALSGLFFGMIHCMAGGIVLIAGATAMGIIFGMIYVKTKSLLPAIAAHSIANTVDFIIALLPGLSDVVRYALIAVLGLLFVFILRLFMKKSGEHNYEY